MQVSIVYECGAFALYTEIQTLFSMKNKKSTIGNTGAGLFS